MEVGNKIELIIVCTKEQMEYAEKLGELIEIYGDKNGVDSPVDTSIIAYEDYLEKKSSIRQSQYVLFFGDESQFGNEINQIEVKIKKYGMKCGWIGNRAVAVVEKHTLKNSDYAGLKKYSESLVADFETIIPYDANASKSVKIDPAMFRAMIMPINPIGMIIQKKRMNKEKKKGQYMCLVLMVYMKVLNPFLTMDR